MFSTNVLKQNPKASNPGFSRHKKIIKFKPYGSLVD